MVSDARRRRDGRRYQTRGGIPRGRYQTRGEADRVQGRTWEGGKGEENR